ncbi:MAG: phosphoglycerate dehydrogenase [Alphaproteobacteria bacterium]
MAKVLITDKMSLRAAETFRGRGIEVDEKLGLSADQLVACIGDYNGLAVRSATKVTADVIEAGTELKVVGRAGVGVDNIDIPAATSRGVVVMNTPFGNAITTAEHTFGLIFALARQLPAADRSTHAGKWEKSRFMGVELTAKTLGIIGCGNVGSIVADRAQGLRMKVIVYDPYLASERATELGVRRVDFDELLRLADFVTLHTPLTDATRGMIDAKALATMKKGVRIVNCARGGLIDEVALKAALEDGHVAGVALDVFEEEPVREHLLFGMEQVVVTPHLGASTTEAQVNVAVQVAEQMSDYLISGAVSNALNMAAVSEEDAPRLAPYMKLAEQLGSFAGQITETAIKAAVIEYEGEVATLNCRPLTACLLQGLLAPLMDSINMVNAPVVAKERNIDVTEIQHERPGDYKTMIRLTVTTEKRNRDVAGTLFADERPRIVAVKGIELEAELGAHMLYITNLDKPGLIGSLGTLLGDAGVNIATFHLGRAEAGGDALALIEVDEPVSEQVLEKVAALPLVLQAKALSF